MHHCLLADLSGYNQHDPKIADYLLHAGGIRIVLPVARNPDGSEITGRVRSEYILAAPAAAVDVTAAPAYEAVSTSHDGVVLTRRGRLLADAVIRDLID